MSQSYEAHSLVIRHLAVLESAPAIVEEVGRKVFAAVDNKIEEWVKEQFIWSGVYNYLDGETSFKPNSWPEDEKGDYLAYYSLGSETGLGFTYNLSALTGADNFGIWFNVDASYVTGLAGKGARPSAKWKEYLAKCYPSTGLAELGVKLVGECFYIPIRIDANELSQDYPSSINNALIPVADALEVLKKAHVKIDALLNNALKEFSTTQ